MTESSQENDFPSFTIGVLTTGQRNTAFARLLDSIEVARDRYSGDVELVVGTDSPDDVSEIVSEADIQTRMVETAGTAPAGRSKLVRIADTRWLLFVDDDCVVDCDILTEYASVLETTEKDVGAVYGMVEFAGPRTTAFDAYRFTPFIHPFQIASTRKTVEWGTTANAVVSVPRVRSVGNFDRSNPASVSGEDVDIGIRLRKAGYQCITHRNAIVEHTTETWNSLVGNLNRCYHYGTSEAWLSRTYEHRRRPLLSFDGVLSGAVAAVGLFVFALCFSVLAVASWGVSRTAQWFVSYRPASLRAYLLADVYFLANYIGYMRQIVFGPASARLVFVRFVFYSHPFQQERIRDDGVSGPSNRSSIDDSKSS